MGHGAWFASASTCAIRRKMHHADKKHRADTMHACNCFTDPQQHTPSNSPFHCASIKQPAISMSREIRACHGAATVGHRCPSLVCRKSHNTNASTTHHSHDSCHPRNHMALSRHSIQTVPFPFLVTSFPFMPFSAHRSASLWCSPRVVHRW